MNEEYMPDMITLLDDEDHEHNFEILDIIEDDRGLFYALCPMHDDAEDAIEDSGEYIILESYEEDGEQLLREPEDEKLIDELEKEFEEHFNEMFEYDEE